jgi:hypothetical protein
VERVIRQEAVPGAFARMACRGLGDRWCLSR